MTNIFLFNIILYAIGVMGQANTENQEQVFDPIDYGAVPDGKTICTKAIQEAIDICSGSGGGIVRISGGEFLTGTIFLKSNVHLELSEKSTLLGITDLKQYPKTKTGYRSYTDNYTARSLIFGENLSNISITGEGTIDGQGANFEGNYKKRPYVIRLITCKNVRIEDISFRNSAMWMQHYLACDSVEIRGIHVWNHANKNNDGIDIDGCHQVIIEDCIVDSDDDGICLKSTSERACENVVIRNCTISSHCNAIKCGTESSGGFKNIVIQDCKIQPSKQEDVIYGQRKGLAGIALEIVDGGVMDNVRVSAIQINETSAPIFIRLGNRGRVFKKGQTRPGVGILQNVSISEIIAKGSGDLGCVAAGITGHNIENLSISNIKMSFKGGGIEEDAIRDFPEMPSQYPECTMFTERLPAFGFYFWHVDGLKLNNVELVTEEVDHRNAIIFEEVSDIFIDGKSYIY
jgi:parallel beta-helix repeat protein